MELAPINILEQVQVNTSLNTDTTKEGQTEGQTNIQKDIDNIIKINIKSIVPQKSSTIKTLFNLPPSPRDRETSDEILIIRDLLLCITSAKGPKRKGLVWRVGSTGGERMRAYMSLRTMCLVRRRKKISYCLFFIVSSFQKKIVFCSCLLNSLLFYFYQRSKQQIPTYDFFLFLLLTY